MGVAAENYTPVAIIERQKKQAVWVWGISLLVVLLWVTLILAAPVARYNGATSIADPIYHFFSYICHQISERSFHFHEHQFAVCARCFGFYSGFLLGFIAYPFFRSVSSTESFSRIWLFAAMIPIGVDFSLTFFGIWENTHLTRSVTGGILGIACAFFIIPALVEINNLLTLKKRRQSPKTVSPESSTNH